MKRPILIILIVLSLLACEESFSLVSLLGEGSASPDPTELDPGENGQAEYGSLAVSNRGNTVGGGELSGDFSFANNGTGDGVSDVSWSVYVSVDSVIGSGDTLVAGGTTAALVKGAASGVIPFSGTWPDVASDTDCYLIVKIEAADDNSDSDNTGRAEVRLTAPEPADTDYIVTDISYSETSFQAGTALFQSFTYENRGAEKGAFDTYWYVYLSDDGVLDDSDDLMFQGAEDPLAASSSHTVSLSGYWPDSAGDYYLIVKLVTSDDRDPSNDILAKGLYGIYASADEADYRLTEITLDYPSLIAGALCSERFTVKNLGGAPGEEVIRWAAYASESTTLDRENDWIINTSGTAPLSPLSSGSEHRDVSVGGSWPATPRQYYLFVEIEADDDAGTDNNVLSSGPYTLSAAPDYEITSFEPDTAEEGVPGSVLGEGRDFTFVIHETASADGIQQIEWEVFASHDIALDGGDYSLAQGVEPALSGDGYTLPISFHDAEWPDKGSYYYLIVSISAGDDGNSFNDTRVSSAPVAVPLVFAEGTEDNSYGGVDEANQGNVSELNGSLFGTGLSPYELVRLEGVTDNEKNTYDTYAFTAGAGITSAEVWAEWSSGGNEIDLFLWHGTTLAGSSGEEGDDREPVGGRFAYDDLTPSGDYFLGVEKTNSATPNVNVPYSVYLYGLP